jgi:hypothetical protein
MANLIIQLKTLWYFLDGRSQRQHYCQGSSVFYCNSRSLPLMWEEGMGGVAQQSQTPLIPTGNLLHI